MVGNYVNIFVFMFVLGSVCEGQSDGVFIVYPFKEGDMNYPRAKLLPRNLEIERKPKMSDDLKVHLVYPINESVIIMTPDPIEIQESDESYVDTTIVPESSTEILSDLITTTEENIDSYNEDIELGSTEMNEDGTTTESDIDTPTTDIITTEIPIQTSTVQEEPSLIGNIFEETGPKKTLRKRMFDASKFSRKYPSSLKMNNAMKIPTTMSPSDVFKNWYRKTTRHKVMKENKDTKNSVLKVQTNNSTTKERSSGNVYRRRYSQRTH